MLRLFSLVFFACAVWGDGVPLLFVPNAGQFDARVRFLVQTPDVRAAFLEDGPAFQVRGAEFRMRFSGRSEASRVEGAGATGALANFLLGSDPAGWRTGLTTFDQVVYHGVYPGIDASYSGTGRLLKSEFLVHPGADPDEIRMQYPGASRVWIDAGELRVALGQIEFREWVPEVYQTSPSGGRIPVPATYRIYEDRSVGFEVGAYDSSRPLVIDPVISYSTYLGGSGVGAVTAVGRDGLGNLYAAGWTESIDFPIAGAMQATNRGGVDSFVVKFDPSGASLVYATYIGGNGDDRAAGIAVDGLGQVHLAGATGSSNFPLQVPARGSFAGGKEGFALKLNAAGSALLYSTFVGGSNYDVATAVALDASGFAYVAGDTLSADFALTNPVQTTFGGQYDAFVVKLDAAGARVFSTYLGGSGAEHAGGIAVDGTGVAYLAGGTFSLNFPLVAATQASNRGGQDAFITKIQTTSPTQILYSTYLGGTGGSGAAPEQANAVAVDSGGNAYLAGVTSSTNFPVTAGTLQSNAGGSRDVFLTKLNPSGTVRLYSTYLGWTGFDWASGLAVDAAGNAYVAGYTSSVSFANVGGVQSGFRGLYDGFVSKFSPAGNALSFSTLYGGAGSDQITAIAVDSGGNMFVGGQTSSYDFPAESAYQSVNISGNTGWVARLGVTAPPSQIPSADSADVVYGPAGTALLTAQFSHPAGAGALVSVAVLLSRTASVDFACHVTYNSAADTLTLANNVVSSGGTMVSPGSGTASNTQCQLNGSGSSAVQVGNTLTLTLALVLDPGFPGNNTVYLYAADASVNTGWVAKAGVSQVSADSVSPGTGSGDAQVFTFVFSDSKEASNVLTTAMLINSTLTATNGCYLVFHRATSTVSLLWDSGTGSYGKPFGSNATIQNSQCALGVASMSVSGTSTILSLPLSFKGAFTGPKNVYMYGVGPNGNTGWVQKGTYSVVAGGVPVATSVAPASGTGAAQSFTFVMSDQAGAGFLVAAGMLITTPAFDLNNACYVVYDRAANRLYLSYDTYTNGSSSIVIGTSSSVSNSQCTLNGTGSSVTIGATSITMTINVTFAPSFAGPKSSYLAAAEIGYNSGWAQVGTWTVPGIAPTVNSVSPSSGSGTFQNFTASATTAVSPTDLTRISVLVTPAAGTANACYVVYNRTTVTIGLYDDAGTALSTKPLGSSATLQNSQCAIGYSVANVSGATVSITLQIVFKTPAFAGLKNLLVEAANAWGSSSFSNQGTWTVP
jgi:hypothetical protein